MIKGLETPLCGVMAAAEYGEDGKLTRLSQELMGAAFLLGSLLKEKVHAVVIGSHAEEAAAQLASLGPDSVIICRADTKDGHDLDACVQALVYLAGKYRPRYLLLPMSVSGREAAPRAAALLDAGIMADCMKIGPRGQSQTGRDIHGAANTGQVPVYTRLSFGGYLSTDICFRGEGLQVVTIRPGMFERAVPAGNSAKIMAEEPGAELSGFLKGSRFLHQIRNAAQEILAVEDADVIVAGGRGAGGEKGFALIRELADLLGGAVGASRVAVDKGWIGHEALSGQSGKTVAPALYINCGIAGSIQHITGMRDSGCVVSINTDPKALIYDVSDYGIVGDMFTVLPVLTEEIRRIR